MFFVQNKTIVELSISAKKSCLFLEIFRLVYGIMTLVKYGATTICVS